MARGCSNARNAMRVFESKLLPMVFDMERSYVFSYPSETAARCAGEQLQMISTYVARSPA